MHETVKSSLSYIERNLKTEISINELAEMANYSAGHFCRMFALEMDSTVASYILKRRLDHALVEISTGRKAIDVVLEYGFDTYAGFYKAFVKMYGCSPKKYLSIYRKSEDIIMLNEKDIQTILKNWDIPQELKVEDAARRNWKTGELEWQMWNIGDEYYLKTNERSKMIKNIRIAKALYKEGLTSEFLPIPTRAGSDYLDGENIFLLTKKVGEPLNFAPIPTEDFCKLEYHEQRRNHAFKLGEAIAKLHRALKSVQDDVKPYEANLFEQGLNSIPVVKELSKKYNYDLDESFFDEFVKTFGMLYEKLPKQLIHGNPTGDSVIYENGEVVGLKGHETYNVALIRLFDVIWCAGEINTQPIESYLKMFKDILKGYDSINPITKEEKQSIYYVLCVAAMNSVAYCGDGLDITHRGLQALEFLAKNKEMFQNLI